MIKADCTQSKLQKSQYQKYLEEVKGHKATNRSIQEALVRKMIKMM